ncbi:hypothetical protein QTH89_05795 [Variovorax sp. J22G21]|uniref:hypothetical protein n=1 Tax=Variovorax fucosicus TaxID=3053517 RepID=UPI002576E9BD|nr:MULTISPECIES: hypothetical protein [unclassified Variovorax]MDM0041660.1 hypothetical protein [Variovorax sp. J22R193]MDM0058021.1 hypothetical protein [Variovorax sp. J22G47]MDM0060716.1 hypothetical protein [Variovorax sp. J22G21]
MIHTFPLPTASGRAGTAKLVLSLARIGALPFGRLLKPDDTTSPFAPTRATAPAMDPEDWDALFLAVAARIRSTAQPKLTLCTSTEHKTVADMRTVMLECAEALEQLHAALACERADATIRAPATQPDIVYQPKMSA